VSTQNPPYPPQPPYAQAPAPKKTHGCLIAAIVVAVLAILAIIIGIAIVGAVGKGVSDVTSADHTITYKVTTTTKTIISSGSSAGMSQETVTANWTKDQKVKGIEIATLSATLDSQAADTASVTCEILVDGKSQSTNTSKGAGASASCTGTTTK
jgi:hypothetical protein